MSFKAICFSLLMVTAAGSIAARAMLEDDATATAARPEGLSSGLVADSPPRIAEDAEPSGLVGVLPYVSEASFFAIIGFALGYASKKVLKLGLIVLAVFFVTLQALSSQGIITVDWQAAVDVTNRWILNINESDTVGQVVKNRLPGAGGLVLGYALGFRKG